MAGITRHFYLPNNTIKKVLQVTVYTNIVRYIHR